MGRRETNADPLDVWCLCTEDLDVVIRAFKRLYDGRTLSFDERRDIAAALEAVVGRALLLADEED